MKNKAPLIIGGLVIGGIVVYALTRKVEAAPPPGGWLCPYDPTHGPFNTYEELVVHVQTFHPGERIPLPIEWE